MVYRDLWVRGWHCWYLFGAITSAAYTSNMGVVRRVLLADRLVVVLTDKLVDMIFKEYYEKHSAQIMSKIPVDAIVNMAIAKMSARLANSLLDERRK